MTTYIHTTVQFCGPDCDIKIVENGSMASLFVDHGNADMRVTFDTQQLGVLEQLVAYLRKQQAAEAHQRATMVESA